MSQACTTAESPTPLSVMWKTVSEDCNLACDYCYYSRVGGRIAGKVRRIEPHVLEKFIREYMERSSGSAAFVWQGGEPLLAGLDFFEAVVRLEAKYAPRNTTISNSLQTNAMLLDEDWTKFLKRYNFLVGVSMDGPRDIHDKRRVSHTGAGSFDRVMRGVSHLRDYEVDFNVLTVLHEDNITRAHDLMKFYMEEEFHYVQFIPAMDFRAQQTDKPPAYLISPQQYGNFLCDVFDIWYNDGNPQISIRFFDNMLSVYLHRDAELCTHRKTCAQTLILEQNGDAYPCDFFISEKYKLGNVGTNSLTDVFGNELYRQFSGKKMHLAQKCQDCEFLSLCHGGCPRNRVWGEETVSPDFFCESYLQVYRYAHDRMQNVAKQVRTRWLREYLSAGGKEPGRNDLCICGSGKKYKKCCGLLRTDATTTVPTIGLYGKG